MSGRERMMLPPVDREHAPPAVLPPGVALRPLPVYPDARGLTGECFPAAAAADFPPAQWAFGVSAANTLRGMHVHLRHRDWMVVLDGLVWAGICDLRAGSPAFGRGLLLPLRGAAPAALHIPPGVAHGFLSPGRSVFVLGADRVYDLADELGCQWNDPGLGIDWPLEGPPVLSARDRALPTLAEVLRRVPPFALGQ
jgi:dTDP-4-dehydrorhamnose 3,5-epimerase